MTGHVLVTGGGRSGKTRFALARARQCPAPRVYLATGEPKDAEMAARIAAHRRERGDDFATAEAPRALAEALAGLTPTTAVAVVDCLTLWISNLMAAEGDDAVLAHVEQVAAAIGQAPFPVVVVTNEVGSGIVPFDPVVRRFRDLLGAANQRVAAAADEVVLMVAGLPVVVKRPHGA